jgi:phosphopantetheinyl transferase (holo-ACP synthase)
LAVGNDVVDLVDRDADSATLHPRFDARVFAASELSALDRAANVSRLRWSLWASKEAAYKAIRRMDPTAVFSPSRFVVELPTTGSGEGAVVFRRQRLKLRVSHLSGAVHAIATAGAVGWAEVVSGFARLPAERASNPAQLGLAVRQLAKTVLAPRLGVSACDFEVRKIGRLPELLYKGRAVPVTLSLSHHGGVVAFAGVMR